jgi:hypothetical protein
VPLQRMQRDGSAQVPQLGSGVVGSRQHMVGCTTAAIRGRGLKYMKTRSGSSMRQSREWRGLACQRALATGRVASPASAQQQIATAPSHEYCHSPSPPEEGCQATAEIQSVCELQARTASPSPRRTRGSHTCAPTQSSTQTRHANQPGING